MRVPFFLLLLVPLALFVLFWIYAVKRGWRLVRLLAASFTACGFLIVAILWLNTQDISVLRTGIGLTIVIGASILSWPITASEIMKKLDLRW